MLVFAHTITPRLQYVVDFLSSYYAYSFELTADKDFFQSFNGGKINYSKDAIDGKLIWIQPVSILFENDIRPYKPEVFVLSNGQKAFFKSQSTTGFDLFAALFFLISRYEEYGPHKKDSYGRYAHENSIAYKNDFLHLPLINYWLEDFRKQLVQLGNGIEDNKPAFRFLPTYDIDIAWSYLHKGFLRNAGGFLKTMLKGDVKAARKRLAVLSKTKTDPYEAYGWMNDLHGQFQLDPVYFFHVGKQRNDYDKSISTRNESFQQLIKDSGKQYAVGIHPSWHSHVSEKILHEEIKDLENILGKLITASRQHYIRFELPNSFRQLVAAGITDDYSMGYGSINGFRASVATSFFWYDLQSDKPTSLLLHPFCFMDANAFFEQKLSPQEALAEMLRYQKILQSCGGTMITIWHNTFLGTDKMFEGWRDIYLQFLQAIKA